MPSSSEHEPCLRGRCPSKRLRLQGHYSARTKWQTCDLLSNSISSKADSAFLTDFKSAPHTAIWNLSDCGSRTESPTSKLGMREILYTARSAAATTKRASIRCDYINPPISQA